MVGNGLRLWIYDSMLAFMQRLKRHQYYVVLTIEKILLCGVKNNGPEWFAGDYLYQEIPQPITSAMLADIAEVLDLTEAEILEMIDRQNQLK